MNPLELYVGASRSPEEWLNAWVTTSPGKRHLFAYLDASLADTSDFGEVLFILGHEVGHFLLGHSDLPLAVDDGDPAVSRAEVLGLRKLSRRAEISADRCGLLCCQDFDCAARSLFRMTVGLSPTWLRFKSDWYASQLKEADILAEEVPTYRKGAARQTHPSVLIRTFALRLFFHSTLYGELFGQRVPKSVARDELENRIEHYLRGMDALIADGRVEDQRELSDEAQAFVVHGVALLTLVDDPDVTSKRLASLDSSDLKGLEVEGIRSALRQDGWPQQRPEWEQKMLKRCEQSAGVLCLHMHEMGRAQLLHRVGKTWHFFPEVKRGWLRNLFSADTTDPSLEHKKFQILQELLEVSDDTLKWVIEKEND